MGHTGVGWGGSYRGGVMWGRPCRGGVVWVMLGWVMQGLGRVNLDMPQGIKSDRTIMEVQGIESLTPKY